MASPFDVTKITVDISELTLGDVETLMQSGSANFTEKLNILERICSGVDVRKIPMVQLQAVISQIDKALEDVVNPTSAG